MELQLETLSGFISFYGLKIVVALLILIVGKYVAKKLVGFAKSMMTKHKVDATLASFAGNIIYGLALAFVAIAALSQLGIDTTSLAAIIAAAGLAIGLALQGSLSNLAAGVMIIMFRPFVIGNYIEAGGTAGTVEEISIFTTKLKSPDNVGITVPNGAIIAGNIKNYSAKPTRRVDLVFGVGYDDDLKKVRKILEKVLKDDDRVLEEPAPVIGVLRLNDNSVDFAVRPWVKTEDYWSFYFDTHEKVKIEFDKAGITIPFPQRDLHVITGNAIFEDQNTVDKKKAPAKKKAA